MSIQEFSAVWAPWKIGEVLGKGSYGIVYKLTKEELGEKYVSALKHLSIPMDEHQKEDLYAEGVVSPDRIAEYYRKIMFELREEIVTTYKVKGHTNIVSYEDHKIIPKKDGIGYDIFIKMEYLTSLSSLLARGAIYPKDVVKIGIDLCRALETLEKEKIIHRDIKPSNIFVSAKGDYKLGDFGVARQLNKTVSGMSVKGTYKYMPPEIFRSENVDFTADIYSLGLVMYILLNNNRAPFVSTTSEMISYEDAERANYKRMNGEKLPKPLNADAKLSSIILKACEYRPGNRWQTAKDFKVALEKYQQSPAYAKIDNTKPAFILATTPTRSSKVGSIQPTQNVESSKNGSVKQGNVNKSKPVLAATNNNENSALNVDKSENGKKIEYVNGVKTGKDTTNAKKKRLIWSVAVSVAVVVLSVVGVIGGKALFAKDKQIETTGKTTKEAVIYIDKTTKKTTKKDTTKKTTEKETSQKPKKEDITNQKPKTASNNKKTTKKSSSSSGTTEEYYDDEYYFEPGYYYDVDGYWYCDGYEWYWLGGWDDDEYWDDDYYDDEYYDDEYYDDEYYDDEYWDDDYYDDDYYDDENWDDEYYDDEYWDDEYYDDEYWDDEYYDDEYYDDEYYDDYYWEDDEYYW